MSGSKDYLGSYRLIRLIRGGQICNVWDAIRDGEDERVALKVLLAVHRKKKDEIEQLRNEGRVGSEMEHPNVIRIFEFVDSYELPFLVMQLFNARNLKQAIREKPDFVAINIPQIVKQCAEGLQHMHQRGWVHCDVKPDNFLVNEQGNVKVIDFSIAQPLKKKRGLFSRKAVQGTRSYMAPEQIRGKTLDQRTDIYGFGCVAFEVLAGRPPFSGHSPDELLQKHLTHTPPLVTTVNKSVTEEYAMLINRLLAKEPDQRPATFHDFLQEFSRVRVFRAGKQPTLGNEIV